MSENKIVIKGLAYEDIVAILTTNGYNVRVEANATSNAVQNTYYVYYSPHDFVKEQNNG